SPESLVSRRSTCSDPNTANTSGAAKRRVRNEPTRMMRDKSVLHCLEQPLWIHKMRGHWQGTFRRTPMLDVLGSATLEHEIAQEKASALGRLGRRLEAALAALAACPRTAHSDRKIRDALVDQAGYALWLLVVQREACGLNKIAHVLQEYEVPNEVYARMGPLAGPSLHS